jgi:thioester reductase-like protein
MQELSGELCKRSVEVQNCLVRAENAERRYERLKDELQHSQQVQLSTQQECARQAKGTFLFEWL